MVEEEALESEAEFCDDPVEEIPYLAISLLICPRRYRQYRMPLNNIATQLHYINHKLMSLIKVTPLQSSSLLQLLLQQLLRSRLHLLAAPWLHT